MSRNIFHVEIVLFVFATFFLLSVSTEDAASRPQHSTAEEAASWLRMVNLAESIYDTNKGIFAEWPLLVRSDEFRNAERLQLQTDAKYPVEKF